MMNKPEPRLIFNGCGLWSLWVGHAHLKALPTCNPKPFSIKKKFASHECKNWNMYHPSILQFPKGSLRSLLATLLAIILTVSS